MIHQVAYSHSDPWSKLVALKQWLKPSDQSRALLAEKRYHQLAKGPANQETESWLNEWMDMYQESVRVNLPEASGNRAIRDFFLAIETIDPIYSNSWQEARSNIEEQNLDLPRKIRQHTMEEEIEKFRNCLRLQATPSTIKDTRTTLAAQSASSTPEKGQIETSICICGEKMWYSDCPYLVPSKAPPGWIENPSTRTKVDNVLQDSKIYAQVQRSLNRTKMSRSPSPTLARTNPPNVLTTVYTTLTTDTNGNDSFLIHDGGSDAHICNSKSAHLYTKLREAHPDKYLNSGAEKMKIEHWGQLETAFHSPTGVTPVVIKNVAYVGEFITSLISQFNSWH